MLIGFIVMMLNVYNQSNKYMKKITLKYYGYRDPEKMLENALTFMQTKLHVKNVQLNKGTKSMTFIADPYDAEALRIQLRKKYGVILVTNLPAKHAFFINFLEKEGFYDEFIKELCAQIDDFRNARDFLCAPEREDWPTLMWFGCSFTFKTERHRAINERYEMAAEEFLSKLNK